MNIFCIKPGNIHNSIFDFHFLKIVEKYFPFLSSKILYEFHANDIAEGEHRETEGIHYASGSSLKVKKRK
jgi:hypothetical protein